MRIAVSLEARSNEAHWSQSSNPSNVRIGHRCSQIDETDRSLTEDCNLVLLGCGVKETVVLDTGIPSMPGPQVDLKDSPMPVALGTVAHNLLAG